MDKIYFDVSCDLVKKIVIIDGGDGEMRAILTVDEAILFANAIQRCVREIIWKENH